MPSPSLPDRRRLAVVIPVYNDWESLQRLLEELDELARRHNFDISVIAIDDGSIAARPVDLIASAGLANLRSVELIELACNLGHQRALALGLFDAAQRPDVTAVICMDADGEDRPRDISALVSKHAEMPDTIIVARRAKRSEGLTFRVSYTLYKAAFRVLTGRAINFGNYLLVPMPLLQRLALLPDIWNNLPAALVKSRLPLAAVPTERGRRYAGTSKMNFTSLVIHGMSAISVFADVLFTRLLLASACVTAVAIAGMGLVVAIRVLTSLAIPGWATYVMGFFTVIVVQMVLLAMVSILSFLSSRSTPPVVPAAAAEAFIRRRTSLYHRVDN